MILFILLWSLFWSDSASAEDAGPFDPVSFEDGVVFTHPEGRYKAALRFRMQNLLELKTESGSDLGIDEIRGRVRRARVRMSGYVVNPRLTYQLQLSFSREDQDWSDSRFPNILRDANFTYALIQEPDQTLSISFGQGKLPGNRQRVISSGDLQFADPSLVNRTLTSTGISESKPTTSANCGTYAAPFQQVKDATFPFHRIPDWPGRFVPKSSPSVLSSGVRIMSSRI